MAARGKPSAEPVKGWMALGGRPPEPPADPKVRVERIQLLG